MHARPLRRSLFLVTIAVAACATAAAAEFRVERQLALAPGGSFILESDGGSIEIRGGDRSGAHILLTARRDDLEERYSLSFEERGDSAVVRVKKRGTFVGRMFSRDSDRMRFVIEVPRRVNVDLQTAGGAIDAESLDGRLDLHSSGGSIAVAVVEGDVDAHTSGGSMTARDVRGNVRLDTSGGSIKAEKITGDLVAKSSGGSIHAATIGGEATIKTSGGSIEIFDVAGAVDAHTSGGPVRAGFAAGNGSGGSLSTSGGGITVTVDPAVSLEVDAHSSGGGVRVDLPITAQGSWQKNTVRGELNGGGSLLKLRSSGGPIRVQGS